MSGLALRGFWFCTSWTGHDISNTNFNLEFRMEAIGEKVCVDCTESRWRDVVALCRGRF